MKKLPYSSAVYPVALSYKHQVSLILRVVALTAAVGLSGCGGGGSDSASPAAAPPRTLQSINVTPSNPSLKLGDTVQLVATGTYSDGTSQVITPTVSWSSGTPTVASVNSAGLVVPAGAAVAGQTTMMTAASGSVVGTTTIAVTTFSIATLSDPLVGQQWGFRNTAQNGYADMPGIAGADINVDPVYSAYGYTGLGSVVAVVDTGLEIAHEDLAANVVLNGSWNFLNGSRDPTNTNATDGDHGTSVSGLIAMAMNGRGGIGVAPRAQLKGFNFLGAGITPNLLVSLGGSTTNPNSSDVAIFNQSFGLDNTQPVLVNTMVEAQYASGVSLLRGGRGALYVKSAGNGFTAFGTGANAAFCGNPANPAGGGARIIGVSCQNANFDPRHTLPYNIVTAAMNAKGTKSTYSSAGSAIWVSAPGGEFGGNAAVTPGLSPASYEPAMVSADQSGCMIGSSRSTGAATTFNLGGTNLASVNLNCHYTNTMNGTSSAAPMMSGVLALILEANPSLTWRDVKHILARSARQVDPGRPAVLVALSDGTYTAEQAWITNAAGYKFHNWYGFGAVDVNAAVALARSYPIGSLGTFADTGWISSAALAIGIPDNSVVGTGTVAGTSLTVPVVGAGGIIEAVQISIDLLHPYTGDLGIELTSPAGTKSILKNIQDGFDSPILLGMVLASNAFYGESSSGVWTIKVIDGWAFQSGTFTNWKIRIYGH